MEGDPAGLLDGRNRGLVEDGGERKAAVGAIGRRERLKVREVLGDGDGLEVGQARLMRPDDRHGVLLHLFAQQHDTRRGAFRGERTVFIFWSTW